MKQLYKNPFLYYALVPFITALWPLLILTVYIPKAEQNWQKQKGEYKKAEKVMENILELDPERLELVDSNTGTIEFDYNTAVLKVAGLCRISMKNYSVRTRPPRTAKGRKSQNANVTLDNIDITKFAQFLSAIQIRWASLQCENVSLTKKKGLKDSWKVDLSFKYYY